MKRHYNGQRDLEGVAFFVIVMTVVLAFIVGIGYMLVQDSNHQTECVNAGKVYVDGNCLSEKTTVVDD